MIKWYNQKQENQSHTKGAVQMRKTPVKPNIAEYPDVFRAILSNNDVFDSSCSDAARVLFIDSESGLYLKRSSIGTLSREAEMTRFFSKIKLAPEVIEYISDEKFEYLLTSAARGEDATHEMYLAYPSRLCDMLAESMRLLHETDASGCPVRDRMSDYFEFAEKQYRTGHFDPSHMKNNTKSADGIWKFAEERRHLLFSDTLIHGDFCLPNVIYNGTKFSSFIDVGNGGIGDRHVDLYWASWSLSYNLKTDRFTDRFFDAYGRDRINADALDAVEAFESFG